MTEVTPPPTSAPVPPADSGEADVVPAPRLRRSRLMLVVQGLSVGLVALLLGLLVWRVVFADRGGARLVEAIANGRRPLAPVFRLGVIWRRDGTWPRPLRRALDDGTVSLSELRGYPVVINFWASWCVPCKEEAPILDAAARAYSGRIAFLGIDVQDLVPDARGFLRKLDVPYVSVRDKGPGTYTSYGLTGVPETYYLDRRGRIVGHSIGAVSRRELEEQLHAILSPTA